MCCVSVATVPHLSGVCEPYEGQFCSYLPGYSQQDHIFVDRHESEWAQTGQERADNWMLITFHNFTSASTDLPAGCVDGLKEFLCHSTLPLCSNSSQGEKLDE